MFIIVLAAATAFVAAPLYVPARRRTQDQPAERRRLDVVIAALRDLEVDHRSGAVDDQTYDWERARMEAEAAALLQALEPPGQT